MMGRFCDPELTFFYFTPLTFTKFVLLKKLKNV